MLLKSALLLAAVLLTGAGVGRFWLVDGPVRIAKLTSAMALVGLIGLLVFSVLDLRTALLNVIPSADAELLWRYTTTTGHGQAVTVRIALAGALAVLALLPGAVVHGAAPAYFLGAFGLLSTFSVISHGAVMAGWLPLVSDLVHFGAAATWVGAVAVLLLAPLWEESLRPELVRALGRLSALGLGAVLVLALTGVFNALIHTGEPAAFVASPYATALVVKLVLVAVVILVAAFNRFAFLPRIVAGGPLKSLRPVLALEAVLLVGVLLATGWLTTTAVPHGSDVSVDAIENARRLLDYLGR